MLSITVIENCSKLIKNTVGYFGAHEMLAIHILQCMYVIDNLNRVIISCIGNTNLFMNNKEKNFCYIQFMQAEASYR